jgi:hypothetical protein
MTPAALLEHRPDLALVWRNGEPRVMWSGLMPATLAAVIGERRAEVVELLYVRDERAAIVAESGGR